MPSAAGWLRMPGGGTCRTPPAALAPWHSCPYSLLLRDRQRERESRPLPLLRIAPDLASCMLDHEPHEVQPQPGAFRLLGDRVVGAIELLEQPSLRRPRDAHPVVAHAPLHEILPLRQPHVDVA